MNTKNELGSSDAGAGYDFRDPAAEEMVRERVRAAIREAGGNQFIAAKSRVPLSTIGSFLGGKSEIRASALAAIADACGISLDWIFGKAATSAASPTASPSPDNYVDISRYAVRASAGNGERIFAEPPASIWPVPREMLRGFSGNYNNLASTDLSGDSMFPTLQDGQPIIFDRSARHVDREGVYVLTIGDDLFVKRLRRVPTKDGTMSLELISDNPAYDRVTLDAEGQEHVRVHGRVIWPDTSRRT